LALLVAVVGWMVWRQPLSNRSKIAVALVSSLIVIVLAVPSVRDQYLTDATLTAYQDKRDLAAKYQAHDESLKRIVAQFDNLRRAQSMFEAFTSPNAQQHAAINDREVADVTTALANIDIVASPMGDVLKVRLGQNFFRVIFPVPMRIAPAIQFSDIPASVKPTLIENSNLGFTVLFLPLNVPTEHFGFAASAEL